MKRGQDTGRLPGTGPLPPREAGVDVVAISGYDPRDRLDGWYDALLATVSAGAPDTASAARAAADVLTAMPDPGVPHDGDVALAVLERLASGRSIDGT